MKDIEKEEPVPEIPAKEPPLIILEEADKALGRVGANVGEVQFHPREMDVEKALLDIMDEMVAAERSIKDLDSELVALMALP